jgi:hypothetical protein
LFGVSFALPDCRLCGAKLEDDAKFCHKCGTPVATFPPPPPRPTRRDPLVMAVIILIAIVVASVIVNVLVLAPLHSVNFNQTNQVDQPGIKTLNFNFQANTAEVNIIAQNLTGKTILINTSAKGSTGIFGSANPIQVSFDNETADDILTVTSNVTNIDRGIFSRNIRVTCTIFINPSLRLNLNITTETGQITLTAAEPATFESLNLESTTGVVQANIQNCTVIEGDVSLRATTGDVFFRINQANVQGNDTFNLQTTTGLLNMDITENKAFSGNVQVNAATTTGTVNLAIRIDNGAGARIESETQIGEIRTNLNNFSGDKSPIQSTNYPAESNFDINLRTNLGGIYINASYQSSTVPIIRN